MNALLVNRKNESVTYQTTDQPTPATGQVIIELKAAALNHRDVWITQGMYPGLVYPTVLGSDGVGVLDGENVILNPSIQWGDNPRYQDAKYQIIGMPKDGTFAEYIAIDKAQVYPMPQHLSFEQAAALPLAGLTAYRALFTKGQCKAGDKVLISGVGGGVALFAFQFAVACGAEVYVTSSSDEKLEKALLMGAKGGANYTTKLWSRDLMAQTGGFDVIIDSAAGTGFGDLFNTAASGCRMVVYGGTRGHFPKLSPQILFWKQIQILGSTMGNAAEFEGMLRFVEDHQLVPVVDAVFDLKDGAQGFERMEQGLQFGKIVFRI